MELAAAAVSTFQQWVHGAGVLLAVVAAQLVFPWCAGPNLSAGLWWEGCGVFLLTLGMVI